MKANYNNKKKLKEKDIQLIAEKIIEKKKKKALWTKQLHLI